MPRRFGVRRIDFVGDEPHLSFGYPLCEEGWRDLMERLCVRIEAALRDGETFQFVRIKQKFGILRVDCDYEGPEETEAKVDHAVDLATARSACTCEICGAEGRLYNRDGWLATACPEHAKGELKPIRPGFENIHIVRTFGPGRFPIVSCRRYIRETDSFVDVDPKSLGIEE